MIRLEILADRKSTADDLANLLAHENNIEIAAAHTIGSRFCPADVTLAVGLLRPQIPLPSHPVVALTDDPASPLAGVHGWLPLHSSPQVIVAAIVAAAAGLYTFTADQVHLENTRPAESISVEKLTARELEVLNLIAEGLGNKEIAAHLNISGHTAKFHVAQILAKFGAVSRAEAVRIGIQRGLLAL